MDQNSDFFIKEHNGDFETLAARMRERFAINARDCSMPSGQLPVAADFGGASMQNNRERFQQLMNLNRESMSNDVSAGVNSITSAGEHSFDGQQSASTKHTVLMDMQGRPLLGNPRSLMIPSSSVLTGDHNSCPTRRGSSDLLGGNSLLSDSDNTALSKRAAGHDERLWNTVLPANQTIGLSRVHSNQTSQRVATNRTCFSTNVRTASSSSQPVSWTSRDSPAALMDADNSLLSQSGNTNTRVVHQSQHVSSNKSSTSVLSSSSSRVNGGLGSALARLTADGASETSPAPCDAQTSTVLSRLDPNHHRAADIGTCSTSTERSRRIMQQSHTTSHASTTGFSSATRQMMQSGGGVGGESRHNMTHLSERSEQSESMTTGADGATRLQRRQERSVAEARLASRPDGSAHVEASHQRLQQAATACGDAGGRTHVHETAAANESTLSGRLTRRADGSGQLEMTEVEGCDKSRQASLSYVHQASDTSSPFIINLMDGRPWQQMCASSGTGYGPQLSVFGPLIIPPAGGSIRGQVSVHDTLTKFFSSSVDPTKNRCDRISSYSGGQFQMSESESEESDAEHAVGDATTTRRKRIAWRHKPALTQGSSGTTDDSGSAPGHPEVDHEDKEKENEKEEAVERRRRRLHHIASELLSTEKVYVQRLHLIDQVFRQRVEEANAKQRMFSSHLVGKMFANSEAIYRFHKEHLLPCLEERLQQWHERPLIGDVMKENAPFLKIYVDYVKNYDSAMKLINAFSMKCPRFAAILTSIFEMEESANLPLQHHMIVPIQRIPRYEMLLRDYLNRLPADSPDLDNTNKALELVRRAAAHSNEVMRGEQNLHQLLLIQQKLGGAVELVSPARQLVLQQRLLKISARSGDHQQRHLFLFTDMLLLCSARNNRLISSSSSASTAASAGGCGVGASSPPTAGSYRLRARFNLDSSHVLEGDHLLVPHTFYVVNAERRVELYTESGEQKTQWLDAICSAMTALMRRSASRPCSHPPSVGGSSSAATLAHSVNSSSKQSQHQSQADGDEARLGWRRPQLMRLDSVVRCVECGAVFGVVRRRHSCHACGTVVCAKCSPNKLALPYSGDKLLRVCVRCHDLLAADSGTNGGGGKKKNGVAKWSGNKPRPKSVAACSGSSTQSSSLMDLTYKHGNSVLQIGASESAVISGWLHIRCTRGGGGGAGERRWLCLRSSHILYSYVDADATAALTACPCPGASVSWLGSDATPDTNSGGGGKERQLKFSRAGRSYLLTADSRDQVSRWLAALQRASRVEQLAADAPKSPHPRAQVSTLV